MADEITRESLLQGVEKEGPTPPSLSFRDRLLEGIGPQKEQPMAGLVGQQELGPAGLEAPLTRLRVNMADTFQEKLAAFQKSFPAGDLTKDAVSGELLFRPDKATPFAKVDADMLEKFEPLGDLIDFTANDLGAISGEMLLAARTRGLSLLALLRNLFIGGTVGEFAQEGVESLQGFQFESPSQIAARGAMKGALGAVGGVAGKGVETTINFIRGAGTVRLQPGGEEAMRAAERQDVPQLMPFQVSDSPILKKLGGQAGAVLPTVQRRINEQNAALTARVRDLRDRVSAAQLGQRLRALHDGLRQSVLSGAQRIVRNTKASEAGEALQQGVAEYAERSRLMVDEAYGAARNLAKPEYDYSPILNAIDEVREGTVFQTTTGAVERAEGRLNSKVASVMDRLARLDANAPDIVRDNGQVVSATDALLAIRNELYDLKTPDPGTLFRKQHRDAARLYRAITDVLDNPNNTHAAFVEAWQEARRLAAQRFETFDKLIVLRTGRSETPAQLADRLVAPLQIDNIKTLRSIVPNERFAAFQDFAKSKLLHNPDGLTESLKKFDQETLDVLFSPAEQTAMRGIGTAIDTLNRVGIDKILERQSQRGKIIQEAILRNDTAQIDTLFRMVENAGGKNSPVGRSVRAALIDELWKRVTNVPKGQATEEVARNQLTQFLKELRSVGALKFLQVGDIRRLRDLRLIKQFIDVGADSGTSIQASEAVAGLRALRLSAFQTVLEHIGTGRLLTSDAGRRLFTGVGRKKTSLTMMNAAAGALATAASDIQSEE